MRIISSDALNRAVIMHICVPAKYPFLKHWMVEEACASLSECLSDPYHNVIPINVGPNHQLSTYCSQINV